MAAAFIVAGLAAAGCGSSSNPSSGSTGAAGGATGTTAAASTQRTAFRAPHDLAAAEHPVLADFPAADGRSLTQLGALAPTRVSLGPTTGTFTPGTRRYAFALTTTSTGGWVYAPTAVYIATSLHSPAQGPYPAPADPMTVAPQYRSQQNSGPFGLKAIYAAQVQLARAGVYYVLALTRSGTRLISAIGELPVAASSRIPDVGQRPPDISTETPASVHGDLALMTTRLPPEHMNSVSFNQVLGKRPIALLFSTPQLCTSRVCGPVTDVTVELQHRFGRQITFIHQEIYVDNNPSKGIRPQMRAFHLETEPWLFTINSRGIITARLEGAFGTHELTQALEAALQ